MLRSIYTERNIEDWDFRHCVPGSPDYDAEADNFLSEHYVTVIAVEGMRLTIIKALLEANIASLDEDGRHVRLVPKVADGFLSGGKSANSRLTREAVSPVGSTRRSVGRTRSMAAFGLP